MDLHTTITDFRWAQGMPDWAIKSLFMAFFLAILVFVLLLKRDYIYQGAPDQARWRDLRIWAALILLMQAVIYLSF